MPIPGKRETKEKEISNSYMNKTLIKYDEDLVHEQNRISVSISDAHKTSEKMISCLRTQNENR